MSTSNISHPEEAKSDQEWQACLTESEYKVLRLKATEKRGTGLYEKHYPRSGYYCCKACQFPLYSFTAKYDSGCGWPAYNRCYFSEKYNCHVGFNITKKTESEVETEIICSRCSSHLGHVYFDEASTGSERHCVNSISLRFKKTPDETEEQVMSSKFGFKLSDLQDGLVGDEVKPAAESQFGNEVAFCASDFHGKTEEQKQQKDQTEQKAGLQI